MPQATPELRAKFPGWDEEALAVLEKNFVVGKDFIIRRKDAKHKPTSREYDAIDYLFQEWDFGYDLSGAKEGLK